MTMSTVNPYSPPRAAVDDVLSATTEFQDVKLWSAAGRIGRLRYLAWSLVAYLVLAVSFAVMAPIAGSSTTVMFLGMGVGVIAYFVFLCLLSIQRAHDMGWSGWTILLLIIPLVAFVWIFNGGSKDANRFGAPPPPNPMGVRILGLALPVIAVIGILAAVSLPAYQDYQARAKAKAAIAR
jgi:uncharacterized membrane protein YhaH (DUF805 family)